MCCEIKHPGYRKEPKGSVKKHQHEQTVIQGRNKMCDEADELMQAKLKSRHLNTLRRPDLNEDSCG